MIKYLGKYRVLCERDIKGEVTEKDFTYLVGTGNYKNSKIYRYSEGLLKLYVNSKNSPTNRMEKAFEENNIKIVNLIDYEHEVDILFNESDVEKVCDIITCKTSGSKISPTSSRNHPRYKEIKQEKWESLSEEVKKDMINRGANLISRARSGNNDKK